MKRPKERATEHDRQLARVERRDRFLRIVTCALMVNLAIVVVAQYFTLVEETGRASVLPWASPRELAIALGGTVIIFCLLLLRWQKSLTDLRHRHLLERVRGESLGARLSELTDLFDAVVRVRPAVEAEPALQTIAERSLASLSCDGSVILLRDGDAGPVRAAARAGSIGGMVLPDGQGEDGILGSTADVREEMRVLLPHELVSAGALDPKGMPKLRSALRILLRVGERTLGTLVLVRLEGRAAFTASEVNSFGAFGRHLAAVIDRLRQFSALQRRTRELEEANRRLLDLNRMKRMVLSTVNHEVRTPLTGVLSYSEILLQEGASLDAATLKEYHQIIASKATSLAEFVNELADLLSLESERDGIHFYPASVAAIVSDAELTQKPVAARRKVRIETEIPEDLPEVHIDLDKLSRAVRFLLSNAVRFAESGGRIQVTAGLQEGEGEERVVLSIWDDSVGARSGELSKVLSPSQARHRAEMHRVEALGLGFYLVREIVELHGGQVWTERENGRSCVHLALPTERAARLHDGSLPEARSEADAGERNVA
jgi:signal transduction histidine kinase